MVLAEISVLIDHAFSFPYHSCRYELYDIVPSMTMDVTWLIDLKAPICYALIGGYVHRTENVSLTYYYRK